MWGFSFIPFYQLSEESGRKPLTSKSGISIYLMNSYARHLIFNFQYFRTYWNCSYSCCANRRQNVISLKSKMKCIRNLIFQLCSKQKGKVKITFDSLKVIPCRHPSSGMICFNDHKRDVLVSKPECMGIYNRELGSNLLQFWLKEETPLDIGRFLKNATKWPVLVLNISALGRYELYIQI